MASSKKKRADIVAIEDIDIEAGGDNTDDDFDSDDEDDEFIDQEVQVEFEARMPIDSDFHGIKLLLRQLFLKANINISELTDIILAQNYVGSVIKCDLSDDEDEDGDDIDNDDDETVFGIFTVINLSNKQELESVQQLVTMLCEKGQKSGQIDSSKFGQLFGDAANPIGFLISERFINIPPQIAVPSFESLKKDLQNAVQKDMPFKFSHYLMISKTYKLKVPGQSSANEELMFSNSEEEFIYNVSDMTFTFSVSKERDTVSGGAWDEEEDMEALRTVMVFSSDKMDYIINKLKTELAQT